MLQGKGQHEAGVAVFLNMKHQSAMEKKLTDDTTWRNATVEGLMTNSPTATLNQ